MTEKQRLMLAFIARYLDEHRQAPLIREIQAGCQIFSYKSTIDRLNALERKGYIKRRPNKHRGIRMARLRAEQPPPPQAVEAGSVQETG
ncbi:MAG: hypothetical protein HYY91_04930 [Candidatus Omnitrophica bacterium]|nr:hypothetical protein [Candidatus Omnitrophota bacterium]